jgi:hypothetical protein
MKSHVPLTRNTTYSPFNLEIMAPRTFECDDSILHPLIETHISLFYEAADTEEHEHWASFFAQDGTLKKGAAKSTGMTCCTPTLLSFRKNSLIIYPIEILAARKNFWKDGQTKEHIVYKVFPMMSQGLEVMCRGCSKWHYADGTHYEANWSSYMSYAKVGEEVKLKEYEIYMVSVLICFGVGK